MGSVPFGANRRAAVIVLKGRAAAAAGQQRFELFEPGLRKFADLGVVGEHHPQQRQPLAAAGGDAAVCVRPASVRGISRATASLLRARLHPSLRARGIQHAAAGAAMAS